MRTRIRSAAMLMVLAVLAACASSGTPTTGRSSSNMLTSAEMLAAGYNDVFSAVQSMRPQWLRVRGATSMAASESIQVYLDGSRMGGIEQLRQITVSSISTTQYLDGLEATQRWGIGHGAGAIVVSTRARSQERGS
jgi:hypothetical protein